MKQQMMRIALYPSMTSTEATDYTSIPIDSLSGPELGALRTGDRVQYGINDDDTAIFMEAM